MCHFRVLTICDHHHHHHYHHLSNDVDVEKTKLFLKVSSILAGLVSLVSLPGRALKIIYTGLAVISLHNSAASNISLTAHTRMTPGTTHHIFLPNNFPGAAKLKNIIFFWVRNNEDVFSCF